MTPIVIDYQVEDVPDDWLYPGEKRLQRWLDTALEVLEHDEALEVTVRLVDDDEITELNDEYRDKRKPTNVLAFPCDWDLPEEPRLLGDVVIAVNVVNQEAKAQRKTMEQHWAHIVIHGFLHLMGFDHIEDNDAEVMESTERKILAKLGFPDPYAIECGTVKKEESN
ncbi:rRNA maturation RNase YbeY [Cardiobacteriaceae bacterium TAE3-ERU3]|nr:rRNA maturation RNase YbeY [Cardiobacteriaceae bacterium TAE3-ERU3]